MKMIQVNIPKCHVHVHEKNTQIVATGVIQTLRVLSQPRQNLVWYSMEHAVDALKLVVSIYQQVFNLV